jgi:hypothetical protein
MPHPTAGMNVDLPVAPMSGSGSSTGGGVGGTWTLAAAAAVGMAEGEGGGRVVRMDTGSSGWYYSSIDRS